MSNSQKGNNHSESHDESHDPAGVDGDNQAPQYDFDDETSKPEIKDDLSDNPNSKMAKTEVKQPQQQNEPASQTDATRQIEIDHEVQAMPAPMPTQ